MKIVPLMAIIVVLGVGAFFAYEHTSNAPHTRVQTDTANGDTSSRARTSVADSEISAYDGAEYAREQTLDLSNRGLTSVPADVFTQTDTTSLDLSHNALSGALPAEVRHLGALQRLDLSHNQFTGVPAEVGQLSELRVLDLSFNGITGLPYELGNLKKLERLDLTGTNYAVPDLEVIKKGLPANVVIVGARP